MRLQVILSGFEPKFPFGQHGSKCAPLLCRNFGATAKSTQ